MFHVDLVPLVTTDINLEPRREMTLLTRSLTSLKEPVGVPTLPGYHMRLPQMVMRVRLGSAFCGLNSQTTLM